MKVFFSVIILLLFFIVSCSSPKKTQATTAINTAQVIKVSFPDDSSHINVNGDLSDWNADGAVTNGVTGITSMITADSSNLYLALHINDQALQMKTLMMGMEIYFDTGGTQKQNIYLSYPIMPQTDDAASSLAASGSAGSYKMIKQKLIGQDIILETTGFKITTDGMHEKYGSSGPRAFIATDVTNNLVYEASIPLQDIYGNYFVQAIKNNPALSIGFRINAFPKGTFPHGGDNGKSQENFSGGGINGGAMRGGRMNGGGFNGAGRTTGYNPVNIDEMTKDSQFWIQAKFN